MCGACYVDAAVKDSIIAYNAEFQKVSKSPFGSDDQIGMLNLIDAASRSKIIGMRIFISFRGSSIELLLIPVL